MLTRKQVFKVKTVRRKKRVLPPLGKAGRSWNETQHAARVAKLLKLGASDAQVSALVGREYTSLSLWVRNGLKRLAAE